MNEGSSEERPTQKFMIERYMDAVKTAGAANSGGFFIAGIAAYYFREQPHVFALLKISAVIFLLGTCLFGVAYFFLIVWIEQQYSASWFDRFASWRLLKKLPFLGTATALTVLATALWFAAIFPAAKALYKLQPSPPQAGQIK